MDQSHWFALYVKPRHEKVVGAALSGKGYEAFVPLYGRQASSRITQLPLFPGYVFCRFDFTNRLPILTVPGVFFVVGLGSTPEAVKPVEITALQKIDESGLKREPWPHVITGQKVTIREGPLRGVEGVVTNVKDTGRLIVSVNLLHRAVAVEIERQWIAAFRAAQGQ